MKQAIDTFTIDMHLGDAEDHTEVITHDNSLTQNTKKNYSFVLVTNDGTRTIWCGLTRKQARDMYAYTDAHQPHNVTSYGWEEN